MPIRKDIYNASEQFRLGNICNINMVRSEVEAVDAGIQAVSILMKGRIGYESKRFARGAVY